MSRVLAWFSCGDASAAAAKLACEKYGERCDVVYCNTFANEHPDNVRFFSDVQKWLGRRITVIGSTKYSDIYDVFNRTGWLVGVGGARCTTELKKVPRKEYQRVDDVHVFGYTADELRRVDQFHRENPELYTDFVLVERKMTKADCHAMVRAAGIEAPAMYRLGYKNNNCIGCVKGQAGYWNKIRRDFPDVFDRMAKTERRIGAAICKREGRSPDGTRWRKPVYLDELPPSAGRYKAEPDISCGPICETEGNE